MKRLIKRLFWLLLLVLVCFCAYYAAAGYALYKKVTYSVSVEERVEEVRLKERYTTLAEIPDIYEEAVVATEDHRFYDHWGIDPIAICRALLYNLKEGSFAQGGSTITQQLAKNLFFTNEKSLERKAAELFVVYELEDTYSKNVILELYINTVYYGNGYYSIRDASEGYFHKLPKAMTDYECTLLAGVPNAPSVYAPGEDNDLAQKRQQHVLNRMVDTGVLTEEEKQRILAE